ncbi:LytR C-terminal domain-containing protein [Actinophytocola oryzae]|uniref:LytR cell envelope-related transcriptional attenuator n=1 Tax=Actinophytocola oryzae TaxID=502181 RepID=A0A4R7V099_9PSEU|nr:LytR C-terminal domain-containing protein [Actinophytocola oryzae]TDV40796.1 LytR cell envelope-related transcriptional attenuator [Actinophytocola oryzae]
MTSPETGSSRSGKIAGVALLGLAAVALVIGLVTAFGDSGDGNAAGQPPSSATSTITGPESTTSRPRPPSSTTSSKPATTTTGTTSSKPASTGQPPPPPPGGDGNGEPAKSVPVRVYNNSKIKGLAATAADDLRADGWQVTEVANYPYGTIPTTTVYFRPGTEEEAAARAIAAAFGMRVEERFTGIKDAPAGVIVIVTNDYKKPAGGGGGKNEG